MLESKKESELASSTCFLASEETRIPMIEQPSSAVLMRRTYVDPG